jgi:Na+(H+)/acetate symporter ActP
MTKLLLFALYTVIALVGLCVLAIAIFGGEIKITWTDFYCHINMLNLTIIL